MVRKITALVFVLVLIFGFAMTAQAESIETHNLIEPLYDFNNTAVIDLAKAYLDNIPEFVDYALFKEDEGMYTLVWGYCEYTPDEYRLYFEDCSGIWIYTDNSWSSQLECERFLSMNYDIYTAGGRIYSNFDMFPTIIERGSQYEIIQTILLVVLLLSFVLHAIFRPR